MADDILFSVRGQVGRVVLNRPQAFNALDDPMTVAFHDRLMAWAGDAAVKAVVVTSSGERAFCAGGDIRQLWDARGRGAAAVAGYFWNEYRLDWAIHHFPKPYVTLVDGITLGGGTGVAVNGRHCVVTERASLAMPETGIGFFPDVGATHFLARAPGRLGLYLGLTGARVALGDAVHARLATAYVPKERLAALEAALAAADYGDDPARVADAVIAAHAADPGPAPLADRQGVIDATFGAPTMDGVLGRLRALGDDWAKETLATLAAKSPTSLKVVFRQLAAGAPADYESAARMEYRMACRFAAGHEFYEGIRAAVVDKDRNPRWDPPRLDGVTPADVDSYFAPPPGGDLRLD